jgi:hypothetical protein
VVDARGQEIATDAETVKVPAEEYVWTAANAYQSSTSAVAFVVEVATPNAPTASPDARLNTALEDRATVPFVVAPQDNASRLYVPEDTSFVAAPVVGGVRVLNSIPDAAAVLYAVARAFCNVYEVVTLIGMAQFSPVM